MALSLTASQATETAASAREIHDDLLTEGYAKADLEKIWNGDVLRLRAAEAGAETARRGLEISPSHRRHAGSRRGIAHARRDDEQLRFRVVLYHPPC